jgi:flagellar L-ring protein precursor FlgH
MMKRTTDMRMLWIQRGCLTLVMSAALWGCAAPIKQAQQQPLLSQPLYAAVEAPSPPTDGSLWQEASGMNDLFAASKARHVGDVVTVQIVESAKASNTASTNTGRDSSVSMGLTNFLGLENSNSSTSGFNPFSKIAGSATNKFAGTGATSRSGDLNAYITTRVVGVLPNGNLSIAGTREVIVNNEKQVIVLTGVIRPADISSDNTIQSTYISEARIAYSGSGTIDTSQRRGWLANILDKISPF